MNAILTDKQTMTSREIAELVGKRHDNLLRDIRNMEPAWEKVNALKFELVKYRDQKGELRHEYKLSKRECLYIATKFNDEARARLIIRWEQLEQTVRTPQSFAEALRLAADQQEQLEEKERQLLAAKPKVLFADAVETSRTSILIGELAKILKQNGVDVGQNRLFEWLRVHGYLISRKGTDFNMPTQRAMNLGLFEIKETTISHADGHISISKTPKVTGRGQTYFINKFLSSKS